ncbi:hypothetical protein KTR10_01625 [Candidatus Kaiserbacteria bacterium]|nr:hypothetical protein [Candidatus Kaiserbacteria bacterium]
MKKILMIATAATALSFGALASPALPSATNLYFNYSDGDRHLAAEAFQHDQEAAVLYADLMNTTVRGAKKITAIEKCLRHEARSANPCSVIWKR